MGRQCVRVSRHPDQNFNALNVLGKAQTNKVFLCETKTLIANVFTDSCYHLNAPSTGKTKAI